MYENGKWKLAPAYDLVFAYNPGSYWLKNHNININGKNDNIAKEDLLSVGQKFGIKKAENILRNIGEVVSNFRAYAGKYQFPGNRAEIIDENLGRVIKKS